MWSVPELNEEYIARMEDILQTYEKPYDSKEPVLCLDEKSVTLHADVRPPSPAVTGCEARQDGEYERCGTANVFCAVEPQAGRHFTFADAGSLGRRVRPRRLPSGPAVSRRRHDPSRRRQPQHPSPQITDRLLRRDGGELDLGSIHGPLHAHAWKLAQSGGD